MPAVLDVKYIVARSERKTVVIFVELDECVTVKAPERASDQRLQRLVARKLPWIYTGRSPNGLSRCPQELVSGETFYFLGSLVVLISPRTRPSHWGSLETGSCTLFGAGG